MELFDSHAHYDDERFNDDRDIVIRNVYESGITRCISAGYSLESSKKAVKLAEKYEFIYATCGISPNDIPEANFNEQDIDRQQDGYYSKNFETNMKLFREQLSELERIAVNKKVVAIGEIGLDYYWNKDNKELQKQVFIEQIELANKMKLPIVIHTRDAVMDTIDILKNVKNTVKPGVFHCCPLNIELVKEAIKLGFYISFAGPVTFKNSKNAEQVIKEVPLDRILIETDSPYLAPEPKRGTRNDSRNVKYIAEKIAEYKNMTIEEIAKLTYENAIRVFGI